MVIVKATKLSYQIIKLSLEKRGKKKEVNYLLYILDLLKLLY